MRLRMFGAVIARIMKHGCGRRLSRKRPIIADMSSEAPGNGLAFGQNWHRGVATVQAFSSQHVGFDALVERMENHAADTNQIGKSGEGKIDAFARAAFGLAPLADRQIAV